MKTKETILARAAETIAQRTVRQDKDRFGTLITIDPDGSPVPTTMEESIMKKGFYAILSSVNKSGHLYQSIREQRKKSSIFRLQTAMISVTPLSQIMVSITMRSQCPD